MMMLDLFPPRAGQCLPRAGIRNAVGTPWFYGGLRQAARGAAGVASAVRGEVVPCAADVRGGDRH